MASPWPCPASLESVVAITPCQWGEVIYARGDPALHWYRLVSGMARKSAEMAGGRRQILDFLLPGDFFGFSARDQHALTVEAALAGTIVARYPRGEVEMLANADPRVARYIREMAFQALARSQVRTLILGRMTALEKVSSLLAEIAERSSDGTAGAFVLPMSREDIADYLDLALETVSRVLDDLKEHQMITHVARDRLAIANANVPGASGGYG
jgi:CRP/FNR family transcriptional regulator, nitrogen fixation regulation protein